MTVEQVRAEVDRCLAEAKQADPRFAAEVSLADVKSGYLARPGDEVVRLMVDAVRQVRGGASRRSSPRTGWETPRASARRFPR